MSALITAQFITGASTARLYDSAAVHLTMASGPDGGFGGTVSVVMRTEEEATLLLNAASEALGLLTAKGPVA